MLPSFDGATTVLATLPFGSAWDLRPLAQAALDRGDALESHAYAFIHTHDVRARVAEMVGGPMQFDVIIGNPPFLGDKKMRSELGDDYTEALRELFKDRVPGGADLVTYWFEKARAQIEAGNCQRAGLVVGFDHQDFRLHHHAAVGLDHVEGLARVAHVALTG